MVLLTFPPRRTPRGVGGFEWPAATAADPEKQSLTPLVWTFAFERRVGDRFEHPMVHLLRSNVSFGTHFHSVAGDFRDRRLHFSSVSPHPSGFISEEMRGVVCEIRDAK